MLVSVMYTSKTVKLKFLIVSKIFRNPGKLTLCWLKKNSTTRIASGAEQDNIEKKKKKQLHFLYLLEEIDGPTDYHYFSQPSRFFAQSNKANDRETTTVCYYSIHAVAA